MRNNHDLPAVEVIAKTLFDRTGNTVRTWAQFVESDPDGAETYRDDGAAILRAIRRPSKAMQHAGYEWLGEDFGRCWMEVIDAALTEENEAA